MAEKRTEQAGFPQMNRGPGARFAQVEHAQNVGATIRRIWTFFAKEKVMLIGMLCVVVFGTLCGVFAPGLQSRAIDIIAGNDKGALAKTVLLMLGVYLLYGLSQLLQNLISARLSQNIVKSMREQLFGKIVDLPVKYLDTHSHGDVMSRMTNDIENISNTVSQALPSLCSGVLTIIGTVAIMMWYCWQLALLSCATVLLTLLATKVLSGNVRKYSRKRQQLLGELNGTVEEMISAFIVYAKQFSRPVNEIAQVYGQLQTAIAGAERVFFVLDEKSEEMAGEELAAGEHAAIEFQNVCFSYAPGRPVLRDFTLSVPAGKKVALVGSTGSGKTTVVNLLMRYYDMDSGDIRINGQSVRDVSRASLRREAAIVLQDTVLFTDTVRNNLTYACEKCTQERLDVAVRMSRCDEMIEMMPEGYETMLTGAGANVSQGQRQLLAIARAFVADPKILILDEATSNVDTRTEKDIQDAMQRIMQNRTSIVIEHRLSTIRDADVIIVMDGGRIMESGDHEQLLQKKGKYYDLYMTQYAGFAT